jgi:hypothetical protein
MADREKPQIPCWFIQADFGLYLLLDPLQKWFIHTESEPQYKISKIKNFLCKASDSSNAINCGYVLHSQLCVSNVNLSCSKKIIRYCCSLKISSNIRNMFATLPPAVIDDLSWYSQTKNTLWNITNIHRFRRLYISAYGCLPSFLGTHSPS